MNIPSGHFFFLYIILIYGIADDVALFWGIEYYNSEILSADDTQLGSVTTDIILDKDLKSFTLSNGWPLPRKIYFNGDNCEMALPDSFPMLPNGSSKRKSANSHILLLFLIYFTLKTLLV